MNKVYFECDCDSIEHIFRISYLINEPDQLYFEPHLNNSKGIFNRIVTAIGYIFGYQSEYGSFDCIVLNIPKVLKLHKELGEFLKENEKYEKTKMI